MQILDGEITEIAILEHEYLSGIEFLPYEFDEPSQRIQFLEEQGSRVSEFIVKIQSKARGVVQTISSLFARFKQQLREKLTKFARKVIDIGEMIFQFLFDRIFINLLSRLVNIVNLIALKLESFQFNISFNLGLVGIGFTFTPKI